jgi:hypothetical protein
MKKHNVYAIILVIALILSLSACENKDGVLDELPPSPVTDTPMDTASPPNPTTNGEPAPSLPATRNYSPESNLFSITGETVDSFDFLTDFHDARFVLFDGCLLRAENEPEIKQIFDNVTLIELTQTKIESFAFLDRYPNARFLSLNGCTLSKESKDKNHQALANVQSLSITLSARDSIYEFADFFTLLSDLQSISFGIGEYMDLAVLIGCDALITMDLSAIECVDNWEALLSLAAFTGAQVSEKHVMAMPLEIKEHFNIYRGMGGVPLLPALYPGAPNLIYHDWTYEPAIDDIPDSDPPQP